MQTASCELNSRDTIPIRPTTNQVLCPQDTREKNLAFWISLLQDLTNKMLSVTMLQIVTGGLKCQ